MVFSTEAQFSGMSEHSPISTQNDLEDWLTLLAGDSLANPSPLQEGNREPMIPEICGQQHSPQLELFDHPIVSWKTSQGYWESIDTLRKSSKTFPRRGMMSGGLALALPKLALPTLETDYGYLLPTASGAGPTKEFIPNAKCSAYRSLETFAARFPTPTVNGNYNRKGASKTSGNGLQTVIGGQLNPDWVEWLMGYPIGATDLKPLGMDKFRWWLQQHGES